MFIFNSLISLLCETSNENAVCITQTLVAEEGDKNYTEEAICDGNKENSCSQKVLLYDYDSVCITLHLNISMFIVILDQCNVYKWRQKEKETQPDGVE